MSQPARALLVIDRPVVAEAVTQALGHSQFAIGVARTPEEALSVRSAWHPHVLVLDIDTHAGSILDGIEPVTHVEGRVPVFALTRHADLASKLAAFERGVDDILTVPFFPQELLARILALMRRTYRDAVVFTPVLRLGELEIDLLNRRARAAGTDLHLTAVEQGLFYLLAANAGRLLTRDDILDHLWGADYVAHSNVVDRHIRNLRLKLRTHAASARIATVHGRGYTFTLAPTSAERPSPLAGLSAAAVMRRAAADRAQPAL